MLGIDGALKHKVHFLEFLREILNNHRKNPLGQTSERIFAYKVQTVFSEMNKFSFPNLSYLSIYSFLIRSFLPANTKNPRRTVFSKGTAANSARQISLSLCLRTVYCGSAFERQFRYSY